MSGVHLERQFPSLDTLFYNQRQNADTESIRDNICRRMKFKWSMDEALNQQRSTNQFCDVRFRVRDGTVSAHRCVLVAASDYFDRLLCSDFKEKEEAEIDFSTIFSSIVPLVWVIDYIYGVDLYLNEDYMLEILNASRLFLLDHLTTEITSHLCNELTLRNCVWTWAVADLYDLAFLSKICQHIVTCRFQDVLQHTDEALSIPIANLVRFVDAGMTQHCYSEEIKRFLDSWTNRGGTPEHEKTKSYISSCLVNGTNQFSTFVKLAENATIPKSRKRNFGETGQKELNDKRIKTSSGSFCKEPQHVVSPANQMIQDFALHQNAVSFNRPPEDEPNVSLFSPSIKYWKKSCCAEMTKGPCEEILICNRKHDSIIYRPQSNKWLAVSHTYEPNWSDRKMLLGVGKSCLYLFKNTFAGGVLENIVDGERIQLRSHKMVECPKFFSLKGTLFCVGIRRRRPEMLSYGLDIMCMFRIAIQVYIVSENCWENVCQSDEEWHNISSRFYLIQPKSDQVDILLDTSDDDNIAITVYTFNFNLGSLNKKSAVYSEIKQNPYPHELMSVQQTAEGYVCNYIFLETPMLFTHSKNELTPIFSESRIHSVVGNDETPTRQCFMNTYEAEILSLFPEREMCYGTLCAYRKEENKYYEIIPCPADCAQYKIRGQFVASEFLNQLDTMKVDFDLDVPFINRSRWLRRKLLHYSGSSELSILFRKRTK